MTSGEVARYVNAEFRVGADLHVVSAYDPHLSWREREAMDEFPEEVRVAAARALEQDSPAEQAR